MFKSNCVLRPHHSNQKKNSMRPRFFFVICVQEVEHFYSYIVYTFLGVKHASTHLHMKSQVR